MDMHESDIYLPREGLVMASDGNENIRQNHIPEIGK
jgi:hypothetical protein